MKAIWLVLFVLWALLLTFTAVYPDSGNIIIGNESGFRWDYLEHFIAYYIFGSLYVLWRSKQDFTMKGSEILILFAVALIFSIFTEYIQIIIPGRTFNFVDMLYNLGGILTGILVTYFLFIRLYLRKKYISNTE